MLHVSILLSISGSTLWHCSQPGNKKWDPIPARTGCLLFLGTSSWLYGHGITFSSWHVFEAVFSCALSGITDVQTWLASRDVGFGKLGSPVGAFCTCLCDGGSACLMAPVGLSPQPENEAVQAVTLRCVRFTPALRTVKKDCSLSRTLLHSGSIQACIWEDS